MRWDGDLALLAFFACLIASSVWPMAQWALAAATVNLLHQRFSAYYGGDRLQMRVRAVLSSEIDGWETRVAKMERVIEDIREAQAKTVSVLSGRSGRP
jgi:hypothetical protein